MKITLPHGVSNELFYVTTKAVGQQHCPAKKEHKSSTKVAAFDFDGTLALTTCHGAMQLPRDLISPSIPATFRALYNAGYRLVIFTNGATIGKRKKPEAIHMHYPGTLYDSNMFQNGKYHERNIVKGRQHAVGLLTLLL